VIPAQDRTADTNPLSVSAARPAATPNAMGLTLSVISQVSLSVLATPMSSLPAHQCRHYLGLGVDLDGIQPAGASIFFQPSSPTSLEFATEYTAPSGPTITPLRKS
jgi:hypothetical protein